MTSRTIDNGMTMLLRRVSAHIGMSCFLYTDFLFSCRQLIPFELEILSRIFTASFYNDKTIDDACFTALEQKITSVVSLLSIISDIGEADPAS